MRASLLLGAARRLALADLGGGAAARPPLAPVAARTVKGGDMLRYITETMARHPRAVVLTQVGSFYEMYFEHAVEFGPKLNLKVARKRQQSPRDDMPFVNMAGFPQYQLERYVKMLVQTYGQTVVLLEQDPRRIFNAGTEAEKRPLTRILTPGTLLAESFVDPWRHNYLAAIKFSDAHFDRAASQGPKSGPIAGGPGAIPADSPVGLAWVDLNDGLFRFQRSTFGALRDDLLRLGPNELVLENAMAKHADAGRLASLELDRWVVSHTKFPASDALAAHADSFDSGAAALGFAADAMGSRAASAAAALISYVAEHIPGTALRFQLPAEFVAGSTLQIDARSRSGLELFASAARDNSVTGTLFQAIRRTATPAGTRLLQDWLAEPLQDRAQIARRLDLVELLRDHAGLRARLTALLRDLPDGKRVIQKLSMRRVDPLELLGFAQAVEGLQALQAALAAAGAPLLAPWTAALAANLAEVDKVAKKILRAINPDALIARAEGAAEPSPAAARDVAADAGPADAGGSTAAPTRARGGDPADRAAAAAAGVADKITATYTPVLNADYSKALRTLYAGQSAFAARAAEIVRRAAASFGAAAKVELRWSPLYSYHLHLRLAGVGGPDVPPERVLARTKRTLALADPELAARGAAREAFWTNLEAAEAAVLESLRAAALRHTEAVRHALTVADHVDVTQSMAQLAAELRLVRPELVDAPTLDIRGGRHLVVEGGLQLQGAAFEPNDCVLEPVRPVCMVTGPNMGGKSTYIRQVATICLLAHMGSFVPAAAATIGVVDRIFCRIGAGDDLYRGRSTFMMEMLETANILRHATPRSLAILDEVGRGTSGRDGLAIAFATVKHLLESNQSRALFATHFGGELAALLRARGLAERLSYLRSSLREVPGEDGGEPAVQFQYRLEPGVSDASHGILVAQMADFPGAAVRDARALVEA